MPYPLRVEYAHERKIRARNKGYYRVLHLPIWIWVFFLAPGPWTFELFARGLNAKHLLWLVVVLAGTGLAGLAGQLPGVEPCPYILKFSEDKPNPLYRRISYTFAWNALLNFAVLNLMGLTIAVVSQRWLLKQIYSAAYLPVLSVMMLLGVWGKLPRTGWSTAGEGVERRYFYGAVWAITMAQTTLLILWKILPRGREGDALKLSAFALVMIAVGICASLGLLPRTRPILPGEMIVAD